MKSSQDRILTTHVGSLPRSDAVLHLLEDRESRRAYDAAQFDREIRQAVLDIVKRQVDIGIDVVSDGETSKISYATYVHDRLTGFSDEGSTEGSKPHADLAPFPDLRRKMAQLSGAQTLQARGLRWSDHRRQSRGAWRTTSPICAPPSMRRGRPRHF